MREICTFRAFVFIIIAIMFNACGPVTETESQVDDFQVRNITRFGLARSKKLALTFDDGPSLHTSKLLDILKARSIKATFFVLGKNSRTHQALLARMEREGHIIANHGKTHGSLGGATAEVAFKEIKYTHDTIKAFSGQHRLYFRAPYGSWSSRHVEKLNADAELQPYIGPIFWTAGGETRFADDGQILAAADWECWSKNRGIPLCRKGYINEVASTRGGVVLLHDITANTVTMAEQLIDYWLQNGYTFVTLDEVRALDQYESVQL